MNIFNFFTKPKVAPPSDFKSPDLELFRPLLNKYESILQTGALSGCARYKEAIDDVILMNFGTISYFMNDVVYKNNNENKRKIEDALKVASSNATTLAWVIGKEWASKDPSFRERLKGKSRISTDDIPADAMELLGKAVNFPFSIFAKIMSDYYNSNYGRGTRYQKDAHLKDTYQGLISGMLMIFLYGVQSNR